jgi:hypothetical protein
MIKIVKIELHLSFIKIFKPLLTNLLKWDTIFFRAVVYIGTDSGKWLCFILWYYDYDSDNSTKKSDALAERFLLSVTSTGSCHNTSASCGIILSQRLFAETGSCWLTLRQFFFLLCCYFCIVYVWVNKCFFIFT